MSLNGMEVAEVLSRATNRTIRALIMTPDDLAVGVASGQVVMPDNIEANYAASMLEWARQTFDGHMDYSAVTTDTVATLLGRPPITAAPSLPAWSYTGICGRNPWRGHRNEAATGQPPIEMPPLCNIEMALLPGPRNPRRYALSDCDLGAMRVGGQNDCRKGQTRFMVRCSANNRRSSHPTDPARWKRVIRAG